LNLAVYIWIPSADYWYVLCLVGGGGFLMVPGGNSIMSDVLPVEVQGLGQVRVSVCVCVWVCACVRVACSHTALLCPPPRVCWRPYLRLPMA
jgi:hypothetical protein